MSVYANKSSVEDADNAKIGRGKEGRVSGWRAGNCIERKGERFNFPLVLSFLLFSLFALSAPHFSSFIPVPFLFFFSFLLLTFLLPFLCYSSSFFHFLRFTFLLSLVLFRFLLFTFYLSFLASLFLFSPFSFSSHFFYYFPHILLVRVPLL